MSLCYAKFPAESFLNKNLSVKLKYSIYLLNAKLLNWIIMFFQSICFLDKEIDELILHPMLCPLYDDDADDYPVIWKFCSALNRLHAEKWLDKKQLRNKSVFSKASLSGKVYINNLCGHTTPSQRSDNVIVPSERSIDVEQRSKDVLCLLGKSKSIQRKGHDFQVLVFIGTIDQFVFPNFVCPIRYPYNCLFCGMIDLFIETKKKCQLFISRFWPLI